MKRETNPTAAARVAISLREEFLDALDRNDGDALQRLGKALRNCTAIMPGDACANIGVAAGSTFDLGARRLLSN